MEEQSLKIFDWIRCLFKSRDKPQDSYYFSSPFLFGRSISGKNVNEMTALQISAVFSCCKILAESVACLPLHVYQYDEGKKTLAIKHPLYYLLHDAPTSEMTAYNFKETIMLNLLTNGNSYSYIHFDRRGIIDGLYPLKSSRMTVKRDDNNKLIYTYQPTTGENEYIKTSSEITFQQYEILHIPALGFDGLVGYSPIAMVRNAIGVAMACEEYGAKFFENGARPSGILKVPHVLKDPQKLAESWQAAYGGENSGKTAVLEEGVEYQQLSINQNDAQFLETRKFQIAEIARIFRVPLHMINELDRATFSNITQQSLEFVMYSLMPWLIRLEQSFNKALFLRSERGKYFVKFSVEGLLRGDYETRIRGYSTALQSGILSVNEIRDLEDMNPLPDEEGGNYHLVNGNLAKLKDAGVAYTQKKGGDSNE